MHWLGHIVHQLVWQFRPKLNMKSAFIIFGCLVTYVIATVPTYSPTAVPTPVVIVSQASEPIAKHQLVVVPASGNALIQLTFYDTSTTLVINSFFHFVIAVTEHEFILLSSVVHV